MRKGVFAAVTVVLSVSFTLLALEGVLRVRYKLLRAASSAAGEPPASVGRNTFDSRLGWTTKPGRTADRWVSTVDATGVRSNGETPSPVGPPILAVGDSFTFCDGVDDGDTWEAQLERLLNRRVLNAGVPAYGLDQAVLRAELLVERYQPDLVLLPFISDDITRAELSFYQQQSKPYFELVNGSLGLRNVPVARVTVHPRFETLRDHSLLAEAIFSRIARRWPERDTSNKRAHRDGENVSVSLLARLDRLQRSRGGRFIAVALATNGRIGDNHRLPAVVRRARANGIVVFDLAADILNGAAGSLDGLFGPSGHYSPGMNSWVATRIAAFLRETGVVPAAQPSGEVATAAR